MFYLMENQKNLIEVDWKNRGSVLFNGKKPGKIKLKLNGRKGYVLFNGKPEKFD